MSEDVELSLRASSAVRTVMATLDACMYCGSTSADRGDEHIIPLSLNGTFVLARAACSPCRDKTSAFERALAREMFLVPRTRLGMRTRRKKDRPVTFSVRVVRFDGSATLEDVPVRDVPLSICFPILPPPTELKDVPEADRQRAGVAEVRLSREDEIQQFLSKRGAVRAEMVTPIRTVAMIRLLAKVAYGFVVANQSIALKETYVLPLILGHEPQPGRWVGNLDSEIGTAGRDLHEVSVMQVGEFVTAFVRLFAKLGAPEYVVIVGKT